MKRPEAPRAAKDIERAFEEAAACCRAGHLAHAEKILREIIGCRPRNFEAHYHLADILEQMGRDDEAIGSYLRAAKIRPRFAGTYYNVASILKQRGDSDGALSHFRKALELDPGCADIYNSIGVIHQSRGDLDNALASYRQALDADPHLATAHYNMGNVYVNLGNLPEAESCFRTAIGIDPRRLKPYQSLIMLMNYSDRHDAGTIFAEHLNFARQFEAPLRAFHRPHTNEKAPGRRLRIGYVSPDFRRHSVNYFVEPVLASHNHERFEVFCYSDVSSPDGVTERLRGYADQWRDIRGMADEQAAEIVRRDAIDILIDLAGHTGFNRILMFARKPAPVQVTWLGYPNTTGLSSVDYRLVDSYTDPPGLTDPFYTERLVRLPHSFLCYLPDEGSPAVGELPSVKSGHITFGSFNFFPKVSRTVVGLWSEILKALPGSRLVLKAKSFSSRMARSNAREMFRSYDIPEERVELLSHKDSYSEHLETYNRIDIGLDTFPYNGTTTTFEALWMGVPVVSLAGNTHVSRVGMSILSNAGLSRLTAGTGGEYVGKAVTLASDPEGLQLLRRGLREMLKGSVLTDAKRFAEELEESYSDMWEAWRRR